MSALLLCLLVGVWTWYISIGSGNLHTIPLPMLYVFMGIGKYVCSGWEYGFSGSPLEGHRNLHSHMYIRAKN